MEAREDSQSAAGANNDEIKRVRHQTGRRYTTLHKPEGGTKPSYQRKLVDRRPKGESTAVCYRCGDKGHYGKDCEKTKDATCYACGGKHHFAKMCTSRNKNVHVLSENNGNNTDNEREEVFLLQGKNDATLSLPSEGKLINILIDSGASTNVIDKATYELVKTTENFLSKSNAKIYPYGSNVP